MKKDALRNKRLAVSIAASIAILGIALVVVWLVVIRKHPTDEKGATIQPAAAAKSDSSPTVTKLALKLSLEAQKFDYSESPPEPAGPIIPLSEKIDPTGEIKFKFERGDGLRVGITTVREGNLYLLNAASGADILVLFPSQALNNGSSFMAANQEFYFPPGGWLTSKSVGYEKFWVVWSVQPVSELEDLIRSGKSVRGILTYDSGQMTRALDFLTTQSSTRPETELDSEGKRLNIKAQNDALVLSLWKR